MVEAPTGAVDGEVNDITLPASNTNVVLEGEFESYEMAPQSQPTASGWRPKRKYPTYYPPAPMQTAKAKKAFEIKVLEGPEELVESFRLRYEIFGALGYLQSFNRSQIEIDEYDAYAIPFGAFETSTGRLIGTLRLITDKVQPYFTNETHRVLDAIGHEDLGRQVLRRTRRKVLPSIVTEMIGESLETFNTRRCPINELSRLIVHPDHRGTGVARGLMEFGIAFASIQESCLLLSGCLQSHVPMNAKYGYQVLPGTDLDLNDCVGQIASTIICDTAVLPRPTREHVDEMLRRMRSGATECVLEINNGSRAVYHFANHGKVHANFWSGVMDASVASMDTKGSKRKAVMDTSYLINVFDIESKNLDTTLRRQPLLHPLFSRNFAGVRIDALKDAYLRFSKVSSDYVFHTIPMFHAAREVLMAGDEEDRVWGELFQAYAAGETDEKEDYGHHVWGLNDMKALGASQAMLEAPPCEAVNTYARFFIDEVQRHPYAVLGAKGVLEHLSIRMADDVANGLIASSIPNAENAVSLFRHHGVLDIDHVREGDRNLAKLVSPSKRIQILEGAYFTSGSYRMFLHMALPV